MWKHALLFAVMQERMFFMLECSHISIEHRESGRPLLHDFSFTLHPGDRVALIGEEGNGKSTLLKLICEPEAIPELLPC